MTVSPLDRLLASFRALIKTELAAMSFLGTYEYSIVAADSGTVDVTPVDPSVGLPAMTKVPLRSGLLGQNVTPAAGGTAMIRFVDGNPSRPVCTGILGIPKNTTIDATGTLNIGPSAMRVVFRNGTLGLARLGDTGTAFFPPNCYFNGTVTVGGVPAVITSISVLSGFSFMIGSASPNVVTK